MKDAATLAVPNFEAAFEAESMRVTFLKEVDKYSLRLSCRPYEFLESIPHVYNVLDCRQLHSVAQIEEAVTIAEGAWKEYIGTITEEKTDE